MNEMWKMLIRYELTPNQFYLLYSIKESISTPLINTSMELRMLKKNGWIMEDGRLTTKTNRVIKEIEGYFKRAKKKTDIAVMGGSYPANIGKYNDLWPKMKLPSGKAARSAKGNLKDPLRWFFENFEFTWKQVLEATEYYLDEKEKEDWSYCRTSQYFIRKQNSDKSWSSELADYCQLIEDGGDAPDNNYFTENIF